MKVQNAACILSVACLPSTYVLIFSHWLKRRLHKSHSTFEALNGSIEIDVAIVIARYVVAMCIDECA